MLKFGFGQLGRRRIRAAIGPDNAASVTVARRLSYCGDPVVETALSGRSWWWL